MGIQRGEGGMNVSGKSIPFILFWNSGHNNVRGVLSCQTERNTVCYAERAMLRFFFFFLGRGSSILGRFDCGRGRGDGIFKAERALFHQKKHLPWQEGRYMSRYIRGRLVSPVHERFSFLFFSSITISLLYSYHFEHCLHVNIHTKHLQVFHHHGHLRNVDRRLAPLWPEQMGEGRGGACPRLHWREVRNSIPFTPSTIHESVNRC